MEPQELNGREDEEQGVLERVANTTASTSAQRNPRDPRPVDRFDAGLVLPAKASDFSANSMIIGMKRSAPNDFRDGDEMIAAQAIVAPVNRVIESPGNTRAG